MRWWQRAVRTNGRDTSATEMTPTKTRSSAGNLLRREDGQRDGSLRVTSFGQLYSSAQARNHAARECTACTAACGGRVSLAKQVATAAAAAPAGSGPDVLHPTYEAAEAARTSAREAEGVLRDLCEATKATNDESVAAVAEAISRSYIAVRAGLRQRLPPRGHAPVWRRRPCGTPSMSGSYARSCLAGGLSLTHATVMAATAPMPPPLGAGTMDSYAPWRLLKCGKAWLPCNVPLAGVRTCCLSRSFCRRGAGIWEVRLGKPVPPSGRALLPRPLQSPGGTPPATGAAGFGSLLC
ncbi:unnamed protein product [Phaeothamnion confervicola]